MRKIFVSTLSVLVPTILVAGPVDLNSADAATIARELSGVGAARAEAIVEYRREYGNFKSADELLNVAGIGEHILDRNRENIQLSGRAND